MGPKLHPGVDFWTMIFIILKNSHSAYYYITFYYYSMIALERRDLHEKVVKGSEILEVLHQCPKIKQFLSSFYNCQYAEFFQCLAEVEQIAKKDRYLFPHYAFYVREMKIKSIGQLLESYR